MKRKRTKQNVCQKIKKAILTGTPAGAGEIRAGQRVEVGVEGIGSFSNPVVRR